MRSARKAAGVEEGLLLRLGGAAQDRVAVREAPEAADDVGMSPGVSRELIVAIAARERHAAFLIGEIFRVLERQIEELALGMRDPPVEPASDGAIGDGARDPIARVGAPVAAEHVARELVEHDDERQRALRRLLQGASLPSRPACQRQEKRSAISASKAASFSNHLSGPAARQNASTSIGPIASVVPAPALAIIAAPRRH